MRLFKAAACWVSLVLVPFAASSLGLGNIELDSALNEPFVAEVPLEGVGNTRLREISVSLASTDTFERYNLDKPAFLNDFVFDVEENIAGEPVVRVTSRTPVSEPFVTFLMDVQWPSGRLLREYTVLLDPPVFDAAPVPAEINVAQTAEPAAEVAPETVQQEIASATIPEPVVSQPAAVSEAEPLAEPAAAEPVSAAEPTAPTAVVMDTRASAPAVDSYTAGEGDTLWRIAQQTRAGTGLTNNQMMLAIYRANPDAFLGNINALQAGSILRIPDSVEAGSIDVAEANSAAEEQNAEWSGGAAVVAGAGALELVAPSEDLGSGDSQTVTEAEGTGTDTSGEAVALLEAELEESRRLLQIRDAELQALQQRIAELEAANADTAAVEDSAMQLEDIAEDGEVPVDGSEVIVDTLGEAPESPFADEAEVLADDSLAEEEAVADPAPGTVVDLPAEESASFLDTLLGYWMWLAGAIVVLAALFFLRQRKAATADTAASATGSWIAEVEADAAAEDTQEVDELFANAGHAEEAVADDDGAAVSISEADEADFDGEPADSFGETAEADVSSDDIDFDIGAPADDSAEVAPEESADEPEMADTDVSQADEIDLGLPLTEPESVSGDEMETPLERTISTGAPLNLDQADPVAEAEFHMAYGLYDQAADLLTHALQDEPDNRAYRVKLIEVYFVWENKEGFLEQAGLLREATSDDADPDWNKVLILGKQLCPDADLFAGTASAGAVGDEIDLELGGEAGATDLDFSLTGNELEALDESALAVDQDLDFDLGASFDDDSDAGEDIALDLGEGADDADLSDHDQTQQIDDNIAETMESPTIEVDAGASTMETPTIENPMVAAHGETVESPALDIDIGDLEETSSGMGIAEAVDKTVESPTIEAAFGAEETAEMPAIEDDETGVGGEFGELDIDGQDSESAGAVDAEQVDPTSLEVDLSGLTDDDLELDSGEQELDSDLPGETAGLDAVDEDAGNTLEQLDNTGEFLTPEDMGKTIAEGQVADLLDESGDVPEPVSDTIEQPDLAEASEGDTAEQPGVSVDDLAGGLEDLLEDSAPDDATMTEVGTKLDLARAYIDMGDPDGARSILNEVLDEGGDDQQQQARQLLAEIND